VALEAAELARHDGQANSNKIADNNGRLLYRITCTRDLESNLRPKETVTLEPWPVPRLFG
jgi:hypothetical protein